MLKKIRSLTYRYAILSAVIVFVLFDLLLHGLGRLLTLVTENLPMMYVAEIILVLVPAALVFLFGFLPAFKKGNFWRGLVCCLPFIIVQIVFLAFFFLQRVGNPEVNWNPWYLILYKLFSVFCVGFREECIYRATLQNIVAKKYANSTKGIWITVIVASILFGLCHVTNLFYGVDPLAVLTQVLSAVVLGFLFGAVYLRSGSLWALILIHTLTDVAGLADSTFLHLVSDVDDMNKLSWSWGKVFLWLVYIAITAFLLRPSKCKQIRESFCFADEAEEAAVPTEIQS